jgi:hypothetical protein
MPMLLKRLGLAIGRYPLVGVILGGVTYFVAFTVFTGQPLASLIIGFPMGAILYVLYYGRSWQKRRKTPRD